jgi:photosystem II stability/assembly factor-like uncharacterized protein
LQDLRTHETWREIGALDSGLIDLADSATNPDVLYAGSEAGLLKSEDAGRTWERAHPAGCSSHHGPRRLERHHFSSSEKG